MSADSRCRDLVRRLETAGDEDFARLAREEAPHLEACRSCRARLAQRDPSALFALLAFEKKDNAFFAGFETRVMAGVREEAKAARGSWLGAILRPRYLALAAGAAALAIALIARMEPPAPEQIAHAPETHAVIPPEPMRASGELRLILERDAAPPSPVEAVASATARVISIEVAGPQTEPSDIVLIVDPEMPL
jgi:hypothetical protein